MADGGRGPGTARFGRGGAGAAGGSGACATGGSSNPGFQKFTERNWAIVAELEKVASELGKPMAAVALNWIANRPGVGSVIVGATKVAQLTANLGALSFDVPPELSARLEVASRPELLFPQTFFEEPLQGWIHGGKTVGDKPPSYRKDVVIEGRTSG